MSHSIRPLHEIDLSGLRLDSDIKRSSMMVAYGLWVEFQMRWVIPSTVGPCMAGRVVITDRGGRYIGRPAAQASENDWYALFCDDGEKPLILRGYLRQIAMWQIANQYDWYWPSLPAARDSIRNNIGLSDADNAINLRLFEGGEFYV